MYHQGYNLRLYVEGGGAGTDEIAKVLKVRRQSIYILYGNPILHKDHIQALKRARYEIPGITADGGMKLIDGVEFERLRDLADARKKIIDLLETKVKKAVKTGGE